jgi:hypothetical protein
MLARAALKADLENKKMDRDLKREALNQEKVKSQEMIRDATMRTAIMRERLNHDKSVAAKPPLLRDKYWDPITERWYWSISQDVADNDALTVMLGSLAMPADSFAPKNSPEPPRLYEISP